MRALVGGFGGRGWCGSEEGLEGRKGAGRGMWGGQWIFSFLYLKEQFRNKMNVTLLSCR